ncbi:hypothetical protein WJX72_010049 [[Myrmecia] bisecta]|uniref:Uncharacterized protein n=1 Tax=[Myrmecia] bisecta TaxID=41462 RepID=A0AAW1QTH5_9CHLO
MLWYAVFLILFSFATLAGKVDQSIYFYGDAIMQSAVMQEFPRDATNVLKTLWDAGNPSDIHTYLQGVLYPFLYTGAAFNGTYFPGTVLGVAYLAGPVRLGTIRVKEEACPKADHVRYAATPSCYPPFSSAKESLAAYGDSGVYQANRNANEPSFVSSSTTRRYPAPAFNVVLPMNESAAARFIFSLESNGYIDIQTRALFVDINVWHPQLRYMGIVRILFEMLPSGGVTPWAEIDVFRPYPYTSSADRAYLVLDLVVLAQVFIYIFLEIKKVLRIGASAYAHELANLPHVINLALFIVVWIFRLLAMSATPDPVNTNSSTYIEMRSACYLWKAAQAINSFNMFLCWVKMFKYMAFMPQFAQLTRTLRTAAGRLGSFFIIITIVIVGSAQAFFLAFGSKLPQYRNIQESIFALVRALLLDFSLQELRSANLWLGPLFFGSFIILAVFVLLNMFIAIISDAYSEVRHELERSKGVEYGTIIMHVILHDWLYKIPFIGTPLRRFFGWAGKKRRLSVGNPFNLLHPQRNRTGGSAVISDLAQMALISSTDPKEKMALREVAQDIQSQMSVSGRFRASIFNDPQSAKVLPHQPSMSATLGEGGFANTLQELERLGQLASSLLAHIEQQRSDGNQPDLMRDLELLRATSMGLPVTSPPSRTSMKYAADPDRLDLADPEYVNGKLPRPAKKAPRVRDASPRLPGSAEEGALPTVGLGHVASSSFAEDDDAALASAASLDTEGEGQRPHRKKKKKHRKQSESGGGSGGGGDIETGVGEPG